MGTKVGVLDGYFETGTEGVIWSLLEDGKVSYDALYNLKDGDLLTVWEAASGRQVFRGVIKYDWKIGYRPYPLNQKFGQQCALGFWVHGIQEGWDPDSWARLFFRQNGSPELRAEVVTAERPKKTKEKPPKPSPTKFRRKR